MILQNTLIRIPIRKRLLNQGRDVNSLLLEKPQNPHNQDMHNLPKFWHSRVVKSSNLTYRGYLANITPVLSMRSSLFVSCSYCFEHMRTVWFAVNFLASSNTSYCSSKPKNKKTTFYSALSSFIVFFVFLSSFSVFSFLFLGLKVSALSLQELVFEDEVGLDDGQGQRLGRWVSVDG